MRTEKRRQRRLTWLMANAHTHIETIFIPLKLSKSLMLETSQNAIWILAADSVNNDQRYIGFLINVSTIQRDVYDFFFGSIENRWFHVER